MRASELSALDLAMHHERILEALERVDRMNASLEERAERRRLDGTAMAERHAERLQREREESEEGSIPPQSQQRAAPQQAEMTEAWAAWIRRAIDRKLESFAAVLGEEVATLLAKERQAMEARIAACEVACTELLMEQEKRLGNLERQAVLKPIRPKLVGGAGDA
jgi:hypothetical protein